MFSFYKHFLLPMCFLSWGDLPQSRQKCSYMLWCERCCFSANYTGLLGKRNSDNPSYELLNTTSDAQPLSMVARPTWYTYIMTDILHTD